MAALPTLESNLPNLTDVKSWAKGKNAPLIRPGGHGLNAQAQQIISNLEVNIRPIRQEIAQLLHARPHTTSKALVARLCGLKRKLVVPALSRVERRGECKNPRVVAGLGRGHKRKADRSKSPVVVQSYPSSDGDGGAARTIGETAHVDIAAIQADDERMFVDMETSPMP